MIRDDKEFLSGRHLLSRNGDPRSTVRAMSWDRHHTMYEIGPHQMAYRERSIYGVKPCRRGHGAAQLALRLNGAVASPSVGPANTVFSLLEPEPESAVVRSGV